MFTSGPVVCFNNAFIAAKFLSERVISKCIKEFINSLINSSYEFSVC